MGIGPFSRARMFAWMAILAAFQAGFAQTGEKVSKLKRVLVYSKQGGNYIHESIPDGEKMAKDLGAAKAFGVDVAADGSAFTAANLRNYDAVFFNDNCEVGSSLNATQKDAFQKWYEGGKGFVSTHCFTFHQNHWAWLADVLQITFKVHTAVQPGTVILDPEGRKHEAAMKDGQLVSTFTETEEWYFWQATPRGTPGVEVTYTLNAATVTGEPAGTDFPMAWYRSYKGGRFYHTTFGHSKEIYRNPAYVNHIHGALRQVAGYDIRGCMTKGSPNYDSTATLPGPCLPTVSFGGRPTAPGGAGTALAHTRAGLDVRVAGPGRHAIEVIDAAGRVAARSAATGGYRHRFAGLAPGLYQVRVRTAEGMGAWKAMVL